ncbi:hypothetical protein ACFXPR_23275 [Nocardia tengchongensis]|uniref:hypothetical protein n=1 Tax=Nocardia tengchongensis TaxID=2055889 RepID=UPI003678E639
MDLEANAASTWARLLAAKTGAEIHWSAGGFEPTGDADGLTGSVSLRAGSETEPHRATAAMRRIIQDFPELAANYWTVSPVHWDSLGGNPYSSLAPSLTHMDRRPRFPDAVVDYTIRTRNGPGLAVLVGGCPESGREVSPEAEPFARQYERC